MDTNTFFAEAADAHLLSSSSVYATAVAGTGTLAVDQAGAVLDVGQLLFLGTYYVGQFFISFDTSIIPNDHIIVGTPVLSLFGNATNYSDTDFTAEVRPFDWGATVDTGDWRTAAQLGALPLAATFDSVNFTPSAYNTFGSTAAQAAAFRAAINKSGSTRLMVNSDRNRTSTAPAAGEYLFFDISETGGTGQDPKLVVTHYRPGGAPVFFNAPG